MSAEYLIEPLGDSHNRAAFSSGVETLDGYLLRQATQDIRRYLAAVYVLRPVNDGSLVAGYYTLSATAVDPTDLPPMLVKRLRLPPYRTLPAALIGRLAVDHRYQGQGLGKVLLLDALYRSLHNEMAVMAVIVDAKDDRALQFYERYDFERFFDDPYRLFLTMKKVEQLFAD
jgi:GNAT superfamily N-acetyltransferase